MVQGCVCDGNLIRNLEVLNPILSSEEVCSGIRYLQRRNSNKDTRRSHGVKDAAASEGADVKVNNTVGEKLATNGA